MNKIVLNCLGFLLTTIGANATTHTVDKTAGAGAQFADIAPAITAAAEGDTILVHSSQNNYGTVVVNKNVVLIGPGHNPTVNQNLPASVTNFQMGTGSNGAIIEGFVIGRLEGLLFQVANNITIRNNYFNGTLWINGNWGDGSNSDNWLIEGNVFKASPGCGGCRLLDVRATASGNDNWTIRNNYIETDVLNGSNYLFSNFNSTTVVANNIIVHNNTFGMFDNCNFAFFENNIFYINAALADLTAGTFNCAFNNNLFYSSVETLADVAGIGNIMNEDPEFVNLTNDVMTFNYANDYQLAAGSPAIGTAADGDDMGIYGADYNFRMYGYTNDIPRLTEVLPQYLVVPVNGTFTIDFSAIGAGQ
jgi:hypothetical protein